MKRYVDRIDYGLTLIELLCVVAVLGILAAAAVPTFASLTERTRVSSAASALTSSLFIARTSAQQRHEHVTVCASLDAQVCNLNGDWGAGMLIFPDRNRDAFRSADEPILKFVPLESRVRITGNTPVRNYIMYTPNGHAQRASGAFQAGTLSICPSQSSSLPAKQIVMNKAGRIRSAQGQEGSCFF